MQQHRSIKQKYPDAILLFRVGDFYETFGQDAIIASGVLGITLTKRNNGGAGDSELAGFPHHALDTYLHKLVKAGYRVAICDQLEDPRQAKGIVKRGVTELVTPGVATNDKLLQHDTNNFLACVHFNRDEVGLAFLDISTGEFFIAEGDTEYADKLLQSLNPAEVVFQRQFQKKFKEQFGHSFFTYALDEWIFDESYARETINRHFGTQNLKGYGVEDLDSGITAAGAIFHYLKETEHPNLQHIVSMQRVVRDEHLWMDRFTIRNLELFGTASGEGKGLLPILDSTQTAMGARLLRRWVAMPLCDQEKIQQRLDAVEFLVIQAELRDEIKSALKQCGDIERLVGKVPMKKINPREVLQVARSLEQIAKLKNSLAKTTNPYLNRIAEAMNPCDLLSASILNTIRENPAVAISKGGVIATGVHAPLDDLRDVALNGKKYLARLQMEEAEKTGISSLKIGFNNVFGYYLEVTNAHKAKVPADWIRKQTLVNAERYITPELKEYEEKITGAEEKIQNLEEELFEKLLAELQDYIEPLQVNGKMAGIIDCLTAFAGNALQYQYCKPVIKDDLKLWYQESRHPVIEQNLPPGESYIANDIRLDPEDQQIIILTGPNMSGKSALLRQTALVTLMAHIGSFVPCTRADVPLTDKIFTRVGASDNLSGGESTFMVEMHETASIINNLSSRSLVLLDEIGRGTSTYDGISIAWSIAEYLHNSSYKPKTLFATHYHEMNALENMFEVIRNYHITHKEVGNKIIFLRKMEPGGSTHSFGIHVARMAGMPTLLIERANQILKTLEQKQEEAEQMQGSLKQKIENLPPPKMQLSIFDAHSEVFEEIRAMLQNTDINRLTPVEALLKLSEIKNRLN